MRKQRGPHLPHHEGARRRRHDERQEFVSSGERTDLHQETLRRRLPGETGRGTIRRGQRLVRLDCRRARAAAVPRAHGRGAPGAALPLPAAVRLGRRAAGLHARRAARAAPALRRRAAAGRGRGRGAAARRQAGRGAAGARQLQGGRSRPQRRVGRVPALRAAAGAALRGQSRAARAVRRHRRAAQRYGGRAVPAAGAPEPEKSRVRASVALDNSRERCFRVRRFKAAFFGEFQIRCQKLWFSSKDSSEKIHSL